MSLKGDRQSQWIYCVCILRRPLFCLGVCIIAGACWSPSGLLDLVTLIHAKNNTPSSCGTALLLHSRALAPHPDQLRDTVKKPWGHVRAITSLFRWLNFISLIHVERAGVIEAIETVTYVLAFFLPELTCWLIVLCDKSANHSKITGQVVSEHRHKGCKTLISIFTDVLLLFYPLVHLCI